MFNNARPRISGPPPLADNARQMYEGTYSGLAVEEGPAPEEPERPELRDDRVTQPPEEVEMLLKGRDARSLFGRLHPNSLSIFGKTTTEKPGQDVVLVSPNERPMPSDMPRVDRDARGRRLQTMWFDPGVSIDDKRAADYWDSIRSSDLSSSEYRKQLMNDLEQATANIARKERKPAPAKRKAR